MNGSHLDILLSLVLVSATLGVVVLMMAGMYLTFKKMGYRDAWLIFIPIVNFIFMVQVIERPIWWAILMFIPCLGYLVMLIVQWEVSLKVARHFGGGAGLALGLFFLGFIFYPYLGFFANPEPR